MSYRKHALALSVAAGVAGLSVTLAACGGGAPSASVAHIVSTTTSAPPGAAAGSSGSQLEKFVSCMRHHDVPSFPDLVMSANGGAVPVGPVSIDTHSPTVQAAAEACESILPAGQAPAPAAQEITPNDQVDYVKAAACMRAHGVPDFPDPVISGNSVTFPPPPGMNASIGNSPTFLRARETCEKFIPAGLPFSKQAEGGQ